MKKIDKYSDGAARDLAYKYDLSDLKMVFDKTKNMIKVCKSIIAVLTFILIYVVLSLETPFKMNIFYFFPDLTPSGNKVFIIFTIILAPLICLFSFVFFEFNRKARHYKIAQDYFLLNQIEKQDYSQSPVYEEIKKNEKDFYEALKLISPINLKIAESSSLREIDIIMHKFAVKRFIVKIIIPVTIILFLRNGLELMSNGGMLHNIFKFPILVDFIFLGILVVLLILSVIYRRKIKYNMKKYQDVRNIFFKLSKIMSTFNKPNIPIEVES